MKKNFLLILITLIALNTYSQHEPQKYVPDPNPRIQAKLEDWQDLKFGLLMHWGAYSQWGIVESWSICPEDYGWCERTKGSKPENYFEYVKEYENLKTTFNPVKFDPEKWAKAASSAGMKYVVFTTKHHDGFSMFDTKETDYKVTDPGCPFHSNPKANITKEIFDAFRAQNMWAGAYFSKPDWHNDDYWDPKFPPRDRNVNYDPELYPEKWEKYVQFTHNQIMELMTDYGKIDILWLDGGWVAKETKESLNNWYFKTLNKTKSGFMKSTIVNQDIRMDELVEKAREKQADLIVVDRAVPGKNQNYLTPENRVPEKELPYPWESCIIAGDSWSYIPNAEYMSGHKAIHLLVDIVCKGGNLLFNIAPGPDGTWHEDAYKLLEDMGNWIEINGEAIYKTRAIAPYKESKICYTNKKGSDIVYAIYMAEKNESTIPPIISIESFTPKPNSTINLLGSKEKLNWKRNGKGIIIEIPEKLQHNPPCKYAWSFKLEKIVK